MRSFETLRCYLRELLRRLPSLLLTVACFSEVACGAVALVFYCLQQEDDDEQQEDRLRMQILFSAVLSMQIAAWLLVAGLRANHAWWTATRKYQGGCLGACGSLGIVRFMVYVGVLNNVRSGSPLLRRFLFVSMVCSLYSFSIGVRKVAKLLDPPKAVKVVKEKVPVEEILEDGSGGSCLVCLEDFSPEQALGLLPCKHRFHLDCIQAWLSADDRGCPLRCAYMKGQEKDTNAGQSQGA